MVRWWVLVHCGLVLGLYPTHIPRLHHLWSVIFCGEFLHCISQFFLKCCIVTMPSFFFGFNKFNFYYLILFYFIEINF
jgi:hypothetical protein